MSTSNISRRQFLKGAVFAVVSTPLLGTFRGFALAADSSKTLPAGMSPVSATDAVATAIGYKADVKDLDYKKYPQRKKPEAKKQFCDNCQLYTKVNGDWGKCQMLTSGLVASKGWCGSYSKKA